MVKNINLNNKTAKRKASHSTFTGVHVGRKRTHTTVRRVGDVDPSGVANLYGLWDWVGMVARMGPMSPVRVHSPWAGLCPEKQVKKSNDDVTKYVFPFSASSPPFVMEKSADS